MRLTSQHVQVDASIWAFAVMGISIAVDVSRSRMLYRVAAKHRSQALEADAAAFQHGHLEFGGGDPRVAGSPARGLVSGAGHSSCRRMRWRRWSWPALW